MPTIGVIAGDGVGPEVVREGLAVLGDGGRARRLPLRARPLRPGRRALPQDRRGLARLGARRAPRLRRHLLGAVGHPGVAARRPREGDPAPAPVRVPPVRQPPPGPPLPGRRDADQGQGARRHRPGRRPREQRGPLRRRRRLHPQGDARGGRDPDLDQHPRRRRALPPVRLRAGPRRAAASGRSAASAPPTAARGLVGQVTHGRQDQRPDLRPRPLDAHLHRNFS